MNQPTNVITPGDWIQIGIALIVLGGVLAAFFAAFLNWRSRPLYFMHYNFARPHKSLANPYPRTPAMAAGLTNHNLDCWRNCGVG